MSEHRQKPPAGRTAGRHSLLALAVLAGAVGRAPAGGGPFDLPKNFEPRVEAGKCLSAGLLRSKGNYQAFDRLDKGDTVFTRDLLLALPGFRAKVAPANKEVTLTLWGNLPGLSRSPVLESAVRLHDTRAYDLDLTLLRGRVVVTNTRAKGPARVWLRAETGLQLTLSEPGDSAALELYGRWPAGEPFSLGRKEGDGPVQRWELYCLRGKLDVKVGNTEWFLSAAPGLACIRGDNVSGAAPGGPVRLATGPEWADPKVAPESAKADAAAVRACAKLLEEEDLEELPEALLAAADREKDAKKAQAMRRLAVYAPAAMDEPEKVVELLGESTNKTVRRTAVLALRHWIGARDGRDDRLYDLLQDDLHYRPAEAETVLHLLHSAFESDQPETYETLITYLRHRRQAVRELAHWHLVRLAPAGRDIAYDASAPAAERTRAAAAWKKLIPEGELPPEEKETPKEKK